ncbi:MAG: restriction endonuclease subunit S [Patescibacteria group bacterium]|nr:restriction endonuclease subunit S [Patescibacteria group bacterium]
MSEWQKVKIGDVCTITKGSIGIQKAIAGKYPMVTLAEERATHNEFQFDCDAVIVPLVSSTGHGHASMKRVHYQEGKFALGSILCAVVPNNSDFLNPKYLHIYLSYLKEKLLVPLMRGAANVSLSISNIKTVEIIVPPIEKQIEIIELEKKVRTQRKKLDEKNSDQNNYLTSLCQKILQDAVSGKLTDDWRSKNRDIEHASKLLEKIKTKKEKLITEKKIKKDKPLPKITENEVLFKLPETWEWCRLGEICTIQTGKKDANQGSENGKYNFYTCAQEPIKSDEYSFEGESILLPGNGANVGFVNFVNEKFEAYQRTYVLNNFLLVCPEYIAKVLEGLWKKNLGAQYGSAINYIKLGNITNFKCPVPPLAEQNIIVAKIEKLMKHVSELEEKIKQNKQDAEMLMQSFLVEAFSS